MDANPIVAPEAEDDVAEAYGWYEARRVGLGEEFLTAVDACLHDILRWPEANPVVHEEYRRAMLRRFPYSIFYEYRTNTVTVYCVCHNARDPKAWQKRLP